MDLSTAPRLTEKGRAAALQLEQQIDTICRSLPPIVVRDVSSLTPYDFTPTLVKLAEWLAPILGGLPVESHAEFWQLFDRMLGIWEGLPHIVNGQQRSGDERRQMLVTIINSQVDRYQEQEMGGKGASQRGDYLVPWTKNLDYEYHQKTFNTLLSQVSDPTWRREDLVLRRRQRVREHLEVIQMWRHFAELDEEPCPPSAIRCLNGSCTCIS